jgi:AraC-like DNA-binding protein
MPMPKYAGRSGRIIADPLASRSSRQEADASEFRFGPDPLTLVLESIRLRCMMPGVNEMTAPWGVTFGEFKPADMRRHAESVGLTPPRWDPPTMQGTVLAIIRGSCWLSVPAHEINLPLVGGDLVVITRKASYTLSDDPGTKPKKVLDLLGREHIVKRIGLKHGGGGPATTYLNGPFFFEDEQDNPLLAILPPVIHVPGEQGRAVPWLEDTIKFLIHEIGNPRPGAQSVVNHLAHILVIQAVRAHFAAQDSETAGNWFAALQDPEIGPALGLMHMKPEEPWTVASLAEHSAMSRSAFAARFMDVVGESPLRYLTDCRMRKARDLLRGGRLGLKAISAKVGYTTESAFSNAFKRYTGLSPGAFRSSENASRPGEKGDSPRSST